jgi:hypothetical protein
MPPFPKDPVLRAINPLVCKNGQMYVLERNFIYNSAKYGPIEVPEGMPTDFASIPRIVWTYLSPEDPAILFASIVHDYLYSVGGVTMDEKFTREEADEILREAMLASGARSTQAEVVHKCVRFFGASHWKTS